ncbi:MAG TPA: hypothetical protein VGP94_00985 [Tepidisphaeraceae bacterium]|nr:hypothetical protein [Tepidisphaeraceae bacterium]
MTRHPALFIMFAFLLRSLSLAADNPAAKHLAPFVDDQTVAIVHLDVDRLDVDALKQKAQELSTKLAPEEQRQAAVMLALGIPVIKNGQEAFRKAGGHHCYFVFTMSDSLGSPGFALVPLEQGADEKTISNLLFSGRPDGPNSLGPNQTGWPEAAQEVNGAVVLGSRAMIKRLGERKAAPPANLEAAFASAGDSALQLIALLPDDARKVIDSLWPNLPPELGSQPTAPLTAGFTHAALAINLPPQASLKLTIQTKDAKSAAALGDLIQDTLDAAGKNARARRQVPMLADMLPVLTPKIDNDRLVLALDDATTNKVLEQIVSLLQKGRARAVNMQAINVVRQIVLAGFMYANDHQDEWPQKLDDLAPTYIKQDTLQTPFVYLRPAKQAKNVQNIVVVHEKIDDKRPQIAVGFLDGHAELIATDQFRAKLDQTTGVYRR